MDLAKQQRKVRALDILSRIQTFSLNEKMVQLDQQLDAERNALAVQNALQSAILRFEHYEKNASIDAGSLERRELAQHYIASLMNQTSTQQTVVENQQQLSEDLRAAVGDIYNLNKNVGKTLKTERANFHRAVETYNEQL